jgi:hypothetical protein
MHVVFLHGPAGAGKYTIGRLLAAELGLPLLHNHLAVDPALTLFDFGTAPFCRLRAAIWRAAFAEAAAARRSFIFTFHPEASVAPELIDELCAMVSAAGGNVHFVALDCATTALLPRLDTPARRQFGKLADAALYRRIEAAGGFDFPPLPAPLLRLDTAAHDAQDSATRIATALRQVWPDAVPAG